MNKSAKTNFTRKNRLRYSREQAFQKLQLFGNLWQQKRKRNRNGRNRCRWSRAARWLHCLAGRESSSNSGFRVSMNFCRIWQRIEVISLNFSLRLLRKISKIETSKPQRSSPRREEGRNATLTRLSATLLEFTRRSSFFTKI